MLSSKFHGTLPKLYLFWVSFQILLPHQQTKYRFPTNRLDNGYVCVIRREKPTVALSIRFFLGHRTHVLLSLFVTFSESLLKNRHLRMALYPSPSPLFLLFTCQVIVFVTMWIGCTHTPCTVHFATTPKRPLFRRHQFGNNADNSKTNSRSPLHKTNYIHGFPYCYTQQWYANRQTNSNPINIHQR